MNTLSIWFQAIRPKTLIATAAPVMMGTCLAIKHESFDWKIFLYTLVGGLGIQIGTNLANDYFDGIKGADAYRVGPTRLTSSNLVSLKAMRFAITLSFLLTSFACIPLILKGGTPIALLASFSILLGICYTGGPFPIAYLGLSEFFIFLFFGPIATFSTYFLQTGAVSIHAILAGAICGCFSCSVLVMNNLRDQKQDEIAKRKTLVVRYGTLWGKKEYAVSLILPLLLTIAFVPTHPWTVLSFLSLIPIASLIQDCNQAYRATDYLPLFPRTAMAFALHSALFCVGYMI